MTAMNKQLIVELMLSIPAPTSIELILYVKHTRTCGHNVKNG